MLATNYSSSQLQQSLPTTTVIAVGAFIQVAPRVWHDFPTDIPNYETLIVLDPLYARIFTGSLWTMAVVHIDHVTVRPYDSSLNRRNDLASTVIFLQ